MRFVPVIDRLPKSVEKELAEEFVDHKHSEGGVVLNCDEEYLPLLYNHCRREGIKPDVTSAFITVVISDQTIFFDDENENEGKEDPWVSMKGDSVSVFYNKPITKKGYVPGLLGPGPETTYPFGILRGTVLHDEEEEYFVLVEVKVPMPSSNNGNKYSGGHISYKKEIVKVDRKLAFKEHDKAQEWLSKLWSDNVKYIFGK